MSLHADRCLVIPDIHQDIAWVERVLTRETGWDRVVFLGDYFDSRLPPRSRAGVGATCAWLEAKRRELGERAVFLLGNHDIQYLEAKPACDLHRTPRHLHTKCGSAFSHSAAKRIAADLSPGFWQNARLFVAVNGWLLSHAGVATLLWPSRSTLGDSLAALDAECRAALESLPHAPHPLLQAGPVRGGDAVVGGVTWQDWDDEFADTLPCPQLVGHTASREGARQNGRSWCLDGHQTCYGVLTGGELAVRAC